MERTAHSLQQAIEIARRGGRKRWPKPTGEELKKLRLQLGLSQAEFARRFGLDVASVKSWEAERRVPEQSTCLLLRMIECDPTTVERLVNRAQLLVTEKQEVLEPA
jgi:putative transcriptional regulator